MSKNTIVGQGPERSGKAAPDAEEQYWTEERMAKAIPVLKKNDVEVLGAEVSQQLDR